MWLQLIGMTSKLFDGINGIRHRCHEPLEQLDLSLLGKFRLVVVVVNRWGLIHRMEVVVENKRCGELMIDDHWMDK
ncbi:hypothetical protein Tco_0097394 [Tanacetum coccineum]